MILYFVPEWSYSRQQLIAGYDDRKTKANEREQSRFADTVVDFYANANLAYDLRVHHVSGGGGYDRSREQDVRRVRAYPAGAAR